MSQFINSRDGIVTEALDGLVRTSGGRLARLDGYPHVRVVVRTDWHRDRVALVSGGGSGHEPSHAGFVGRGLLSAAVCGDVFASPSVDAVLAGILAVTGEAGCLLIVKNYTGDRLNFGLAAERARALGRKVAMVIVDDDIALPDLPQARGLAGTLFVHKIAGAAAEGGANLETVAALAQRVINCTRSIGMSLDTCTVPGSPKEVRIPQGKAELGLGIHGEPGRRRVALQAVDAIVEDMVGAITADLAPARGSELLLLVNGFGATPSMELYLTYGRARRLLEDKGLKVARSLVGDYCTSLDMAGCSLTVTLLDDELRGLWDAPVHTAALRW